MPKPKQRDQRRRNGVFYTPDTVVRYIVDRTLGTRLANATVGEKIRILEPACGDGAFLIGAFRALVEWYGLSAADARADAGRRIDIAKRHLFAVELSPDSVNDALWSLAQEVAPNRSHAAADALRENIRCGNALVESDFSDLEETSIRPFDWPVEFPDEMARPEAGFDVVIGNPPFVNIRTLTREHGRSINGYLRSRFQCARRAYDLYVLFCERAFQLLRPGGMCGFILPNKIGTLEYATECRRMLIEETKIHSITDVSDCPIFTGASVYPYILVWEKSKPAVDHRLAVFQISSSEGFDEPGHARLLQQSTLRPASGFPLQGDLMVESRVPTSRLAQVARLNCGTAGFQAKKIAASLSEKSQATDNHLLPFIVSGNIDRYRIRRGKVRFAKRLFADPVLSAATPSISDLKRRLFVGPKIVISGLSRRLEAAWDDAGCALGVQVYAAVPDKMDPWYLLALLNSKLFTYLFKLRFQAKKLGGGFLSVNKGQLSSLPVRIVDPDDSESMDQQRELVSLARELTARYTDIDVHVDQQDCRKHVLAMENKLDALVYQLYRLSGDEIEKVAASIDQP